MCTRKEGRKQLIVPILKTSSIHADILLTITEGKTYKDPGCKIQVT